MGEVIEYRSAGALRPRTQALRRIALWMNLIPLLIGTAAVFFWWITGGGYWIYRAGDWALLPVAFCVAGGIVLLRVHVSEKSPEGARRASKRAALVTLGVILSVPVAGYGGMYLVHRLHEETSLTIENESDVPLGVGMMGNPILEKIGVLVPPRGRCKKQINKWQLPLTVRSRVVGRPEIVIPAVPAGKFHPLLGYRIRWDGAKWERVR